jgi:hypothetical protein
MNMGAGIFKNYKPVFSTVLINRSPVSRINLLKNALQGRTDDVNNLPTFCLLNDYLSFMLLICLSGKIVA